MPSRTAGHQLYNRWEWIKTIISQLVNHENVTEELKANNQMEWVRCMNSIKNRAEEIILNELIYEEVL